MGPSSSRPYGYSTFGNGTHVLIDIPRNGTTERDELIALANESVGRVVGCSGDVDTSQVFVASASRYYDMNNAWLSIWTGVIAPVMHAAFRKACVDDWTAPKMTTPSTAPTFEQGRYVRVRDVPLDQRTASPEFTPDMIKAIGTIGIVVGNLDSMPFPIVYHVENDHGKDYMYRQDWLGVVSSDDVDARLKERLANRLAFYNAIRAYENDARFLAAAASTTHRRRADGRVVSSSTTTTANDAIVARLQALELKIDALLAKLDS